MMSLLLALSVPLILAGHPSYAAPTKIAPAVVAKARAMEAQCRARGGKIDHTSKPVAFIDVNRDGRPDYLFDENAVVCQGAPDTFAAGDGPHVEVFIADATGDAQSVFRVPAKGMRIERAADGGIVKLMVAGTACDAKASASLAPTCERTLVWNATTQKLGLAPLPSAVAAKPARLPPTVAAMVKSLEKECRDSGGKPASGKFPIGVDLNGDGLDDYVVALDEFPCDGARMLMGGAAGAQLIVYAANGKGDAPIAWNDDLVFGYDIDRSGKAPVLYVSVSGRACGDTKTKALGEAKYCQRPLKWNSAKQRFDYAALSLQRPIPSR